MNDFFRQSGVSGVGPFLVRAVVLVAMLGLTHVGISLFPSQHEGYLAAVIDKQERLQQTPSPKLVLVGGSNLSFSVDSARLEQELGLPVVNMGLGIYAGFRFMLDSVAPHLRSGDIVLVVPEYQLFYGLYDGDEELLDVLEAFPTGIRYIGSMKQAYTVIRRIPTHAKKKFHRLIQSFVREPDAQCLYCRRAFDERGDLTAHLNREPQDISEMVIFRARRKHTAIDEKAIEGLVRFSRNARKVGARVAVLWPGVPEKQFEENRKEIEALHDRISGRGDLKILAGPSDNVYPLELFFDWIYHMNRTGRDRRTDDVLARVRAFMDAADPS